MRYAAQAMKIASIIGLFFLLPIIAQGQNTARMLSGTNIVTSCPYTIQATDQTKLLVLNSAAACAVTLPVATTTNFGAGALFSVRNLGVGTVTITPTTSTIDGVATMVLVTGAGADIYSDGTNYESQKGAGGSGSAAVGNNGDLQMKATGGTLAASHINDNGSTVLVAEDQTNKGPNPWVDIRAFGARTCNQGTAPCNAGVTGSINSGTATLTLNTASTFVNGDGIVVYGAGSASGLSTPSAPTVTNAIAEMGVGTDLTVVGAAGATSKCYKIIARTTAGGYTPASPETCFATGQATLGIVTVNLTSCTRSGATVSCVTASPHPLANVYGSEVYIGGGSGTIDNSFRGWRSVNNAADSTHFTYIDNLINTNNGASTSTTGGTATFFVANHLSWTAVSGAWIYYIYGGASGAETLIGVSRPQNLYASRTYTTWDDFTNLMGNYYFPAWIPTSPPSVGANNNLSTTIASGGGTTTLTLAATAGASVSSAGIRLDAGVAILAAATYAHANNAPLYIPSTQSAGANNYFIVNNYTDVTFGSNFGSAISWIQSGEMWLNETLAISGNNLIYKGDSITSLGDVGGGENNWGNWPKIYVLAAQPGIYLSNAQGFTVRGIDMQPGGTGPNGNVMMLTDTNGGGFNGYFADDTFISGTSVNDLMGYGLIIRGGLSGIEFNNLNAGGGVATDGATHNAGVFCNFCGDFRVRHAYNTRTGYTFLGSSGEGITIESEHYNGGYMPLLSAMGSGMSITLGNEGFPLIMDTVGHPCLSVFGGNPAIVANRDCNPTGYNPFTSPAITGDVVASVNTGTISNDPPNYQDTEGATFQYSGGSLVFNVTGPGGISVDPTSSIFVQGTPVAAPTCSVSTGGSISIATWKFIVVPIWWNGKVGYQSAPSLGCPTTTGNQTITVNWTISAGSPQSMNLLASNGGGFGLVANYPVTTTSVVLSTLTPGSVPSFVPLGGPTMLLPGVQGVSTTALDLSPTTFATLGTPNNGTTIYCLDCLVGSNPCTGSSTGAIATRLNGAWSCGGGGGGAVYPSGTGIPRVLSGTSWGTTIPDSAALTGQLLTAANGATSAFLSPGIADGNGGLAVTTTPYTIQCDSGTTLLDRAHLIRFQTGASVVTVPLSTASGCTGNFVVSVVDESVATLTFNSSSPDTFSVYNGSTAATAQTSFTLAPGQHATLSQGASGLWEVRLVAGLPNQGVFNIAQDCAGQVNCFQTPWNTQQDITCNWTNASTTVTCTDGPFTAADVGKNIVGFNTCKTTLTINATNPIGSTSTTISSYTSPTQVVISATPSATVASAGCIYWGNPDDAATSAADTAAVASPNCPTIQLPAGTGMWFSSHFITEPNSCIIRPEESGQAYITYGYRITGMGGESTTVLIPPSFNFSSCTGGTGSSCFGTPVTTSAGVTLDHWTLTGGGLSGSGNATTHQIVAAGGNNSYANLYDFGCTNLMTAAPSFVGVFVYAFHSILNHVNLDGCGSIGIELGGGGTVLVRDSSFEDSKTTQMYILSGSVATLMGGSAIQLSVQSSASSDIVSDFGALIMSRGDGIFPNGASLATMIGVHVYTNGAFVCDGCNITMTSGSSNRALQLDSSGGRAFLTTANLNGGGGSGSVPFFLNSSTAIMYDNGFNNFNGVAPFYGAGTVYGSASVTGATLAAGNVALTSGWSTSTVGTVSGSSLKGQFTITLAGTPASPAVVTVTFPSTKIPFIVPPICSMLDVGGTNPFPTSIATGTITSGAGGASAVAFTITGTLTAADTMTLQYECSIP